MKIGMVTIGQSPRPDVVSEIRDILGRVEIVEKGCLDRLSKKQLESLKPKKNEPFLVTVLRDGGLVYVSRRKVMKLLQECIIQLEDDGVTLIVLLCTEDFPNLKSKRLIIEPGKLIPKLVQGLLGKEKKLGVIIPSTGQTDQAKKKWSNLDPVIAVACPYENPEKIEEAAKMLRARDVDLTVFDCIGYTMFMKQKVNELTGKPGILVRTFIAGISRELC